MPDLRGSYYALNGNPVASPDEEVWAPIVIGEDLDGQERRSPYQRLTWRKTVGEHCDLDWFDFDGLELASMTCTPPGEVASYRVFTQSQRCVSVTMRAARGVAREVVANFLVDTRDTS